MNQTRRHLGVGILGCGNLLKPYVEGLRHFPWLQIERCADVDLALARQRAEAQKLPAWGLFDDILAGGILEPD